MKLSKRQETIFYIINFALAVLTIVMCLIVTGRMMKNDNTLVSVFLCLAIISEALYMILSFIVNNKVKDRIRAVAVFLIYIAAAVLAYTSRFNSRLFYYSAFLVVLAMAINQFLVIGAILSTTFEAVFKPLLI